MAAIVEPSKTANAEPELEPSFMVRNLNGVASAILVVDDPFATDDAEDETLLLVGTSAGSVYVSERTNYNT